VLALESADLGTVGAVAKQLESSFGIGHTELGLLATASSMVAAAATIPIGVLVDRVIRVRLLVASIVLWALAMILIGAAGSYGWLLIMRLFLGGATATAGPAIASLAGDLFPAGQRARIYGLILSGELVGTGIGFLLSGYVAALLSWRFAFWSLALPAIALAYLLHRRLPEPERGRQASLSSAPEPGGSPAEPPRMSIWKALRRILRTRTNLILIVASAVGYFFFSGVRTFVVVFSRDEYRLSQAAAVTLLAIIGIGAVAGVLLGGRVADRRLRRGHRTARLTVAAVAYLAAAAILCPAFLMPTLVLGLPLYISGALAMSAPNPPLDAARLDIMPPTLWGRAEGVRTLLRTAAVAFAPLLFGWVADQFGGHGNGAGLRLAYLVMLVPLALSGLIVLYGVRYYQGDVAKAAAPQVPGGKEPDPGPPPVTVPAESGR
jgi:predicted MFS family arabinose efflux permease